MFVVKVDIGSKQKYIFASNRLKQIIGASEIIRFVTEDLAKDVLKTMGKNYSLYSASNFGNVLFEAGGNSMYIFDNKEEARKFNKIFSRFVIEYFDGLELIIVIKEFDIEKRNIVDLYEELEQALTKKKGERNYQFKRLSYGLTRVCSNTRKPAGYEYNEPTKDEENNNEESVSYISKESEDKLRFYDLLSGSNNYENKQCEYKIGTESIDLKKMKKDAQKRYDLENGFKFTNELDVIAGSKNEGSYIGITCIDGNGMGKKIASFNESYKVNSNVLKSNYEYIEKFRTLTKEIDTHYKETFNKVLEELTKNYDSYCKEIGYQKESKTLPIRPIILAGDDITFISNGKLAIDITRLFTEEITKRKVKFGTNEYKLTTSAGIAIVKRNHPFSRAVKLAGALEKNSKKKLRTMSLLCGGESTENLKDASFIDWEINRGDTVDDISIIRNNELVAKPYVVLATEKITYEKEKCFESEKLKTIINCDFDKFDKVLKQINESGAKSNIKSFFRSMNSNEIDSELFYLKYNLKENFENEVVLKEIKPIIYDAVDAMDLYTYVKGEQ